MKVANDSQAPLGMALMGVAFVVVMALAVLWPRTPADQSTGYSNDGEPVQSDTVKPFNQLTAPQSDRDARRYK